MHMKRKTIKFARTKEGLYAYTPGKEFIDKVAKNKNLTPPAAAPKKKGGGLRDDTFPILTQCYDTDDDTDDDSDTDPDMPGLMSRSIGEGLWVKGRLHGRP